MKLVWAPEALRDRTAIFDYIETRDPDAAARMDELFDRAAGTLSFSPWAGYPGEVAGTREWKAHRNYRVVYEIVDDVVHTLMVIHTSRLWPPDLR